MHVVVMDKGRVAAAGTDRRAEAAAAGASTSCGSRPTGRRSWTSSRASAGIECHATDDDVMRVFVPARAGRARVFALAAANGVQVRHLRPSVPTLEDVFAKRGGRKRRRPASPCRSMTRATGAIGGRREPRRQRLDGDRDGGHPDAVVKRAASSACCCWRGCRSWSARCRSTSSTNFPQAAILAVDARDVPRLPRQQERLRLLHHGLRRRRPDRERSPRERAADLPVEAADAGRVHRRQDGHPGGVPAARHLGAGDAAAPAPGRCSRAASRSSREHVYLFPAITLFSFVQALRGQLSRCWRCRRCRTAAGTSASCTPAVFFTRGALRRPARRHRQHGVSWVSFPPTSSRSATLIFRLPPAIDTPGRCRCSSSSRLHRRLGLVLERRCAAWRSWRERRRSSPPTTSRSGTGRSSA